MQNIYAFTEKYLANVRFPKSLVWTDVAEIIIISFLVYHIIAWIRRTTRTWAFVRGLIVIMAFLAIAAFFNMSTILWIAGKVLSIAAIALVILLQPELRRALEQLGQKSYFGGFFSFEAEKDQKEKFSDRTIHEIVRAAFEMGRVKTGALIVIEQNNNLSEYERTGIEVDALVSSQLLINIFEHNTPLHDGAVIIRGNRVTWATCYLPLSDNRLISKDLGTRHRAGMGISEATDAITVIVSEETGRVSLAKGGDLHRNMDSDTLIKELELVMKKDSDDKKKKLSWKGRGKREAV